MYNLMEYPRQRRDQVELGLATLADGMQLQLMIGRHAANPRLPQIRALQVCADGLRDVYAILTSGSEDVSGHLGPWQVALASRDVLPPMAARGVIESGLIMPTARVVGVRRHPVWTINASAITPEARRHVCQMFGWQEPQMRVCQPANEPSITPGGDGQGSSNDERANRRARERT